MTSNLSRQYLKAMGIDSWQRRDAQAPVATSHRELASLQTTSSRSIESGPEVQLATAHSRPIAQWSVSSFDESLRESKVVVSDLAEGGQILLALERDLTSPTEDLLAAMLKAIKVDRLSQPTVTFSQSAEGDLFSEVCVRVKPAIVVVMALLTDSSLLTELDSHRQDLHHFSWLNVPVAITLHPQVLLENPDGKRPAWEDLKRVKAFLGS